MSEITNNLKSHSADQGLDSKPPAPSIMACPFCNTGLVMVGVNLYNGVCCAKCFKMFRLGNYRKPPAPKSGKSPRHPDSAISAGIFGLLSPIPLIGLVAVMAGTMGLSAIRKTEELRGKKWCWFGIITGGVASLAYLIFALWFWLK